MKVIIALLLAVMVFWVGKRIYSTYQKAEKETYSGERRDESPPKPTDSALPGLPASLESSLAAAEKRGAAGLRDWLSSYRIYVHDPRLAAIELDYVVLISHQDPAEARRIFKEVHDRTSSSSPVYERVKKLESTFQ